MFNIHSFVNFHKSHLPQSKLLQKELYLQIGGIENETFLQKKILYFF